MRWELKNGEPNRMKTAKQAVATYIAEEMDLPVHADDVYIVWFCKTLQNWKALISTDVFTHGIYFEVTYNGDKDEMYLDHYEKVMNEVIKMEPFHVS